MLLVDRYGFIVPGALRRLIEKKQEEAKIKMVEDLGKSLFDDNDPDIKILDQWGYDVRN